MLGPILLAALIGVAPVPTPAPAPSPTTLPMIFHGVASPICDSLHSAIMPIGYVSKVNDAALHAMAQSTQSFLGYAATASRFGPAEMLDASRVDAVAQQLFRNITLEDGYMRQSVKKYSPGSDPKLDALRRHAQSLIETQLALANRYEQFAANYLSAQSTAAIMGNGASDIFADPSGRLRRSTSQMFDAIVGSTKGLNLSSSSRSQLVRALRAQEGAFTSGLIGAYNRCRGTKFTELQPSPEPTR